LAGRSALATSLVSESNETFIRDTSRTQELAVRD
jgi:hypothetical protein